MSQDDLSVENANDRFKKLGKSGSELFAIPTLGETYNEINGAISVATTMGPKRQITLPIDQFRELGFEPGDEFEMV